MAPSRSGETRPTDPVFDTEVYRPPAWLRAAVALCAAAACPVVFVFTTTPGVPRWQSTAVAASGIYVVLLALHALTVRLVLTTDGATGESLLRTRRFVPWSDVDSVTLGPLPNSHRGGCVSLALLLPWTLVTTLALALNPAATNTGWDTPGLLLSMGAAMSLPVSLVHWFMPNCAGARAGSFGLRVIDLDLRVVLSLPALSRRRLGRLFVRCESLGVPCHDGHRLERIRRPD